ncbi:hypothetical protein M407DRAFT_27410 [Tulasnella calospora MUT 4182]|uniref:Uncharacterized protein n=1 Tax=Tulasnella calospora MUT 4182 TaxID=1051891 RepID=A0A0C3LNT6_9AGAM|nr:hypothetical protein M407DRAFT_27410 [Tulasnella calospora MUT 4182]
MSSLTRSKPSFIIYRDEPVAGDQTQQSTPPTPTTVTSTRLTISTSVSLKDKENSAPYSAVDKSGKNKAPKLTRSLSAPTSPVLASDSEGAKAIRHALATKFVAAPAKSSKSKSSSSESSANKVKSKSKSLSSSKRAVTSATSSSSNATASTAAPKLKRSSTSPSPSTSQKKKPARKPSLLAPLPEEGSGVVAEEPTACGPDGFTMADRLARDLTQLPLGDISEAFPTSPIPEGFANSLVAGVSRKRTRAHSINARDEEPTSVTVEAPSSSQHLAAEAGPSSSQATTVISNASPHKRVRLSPLVESAELPAVSPLPTLVDLPRLGAQTTVEDLRDELDVEAALIDFSMDETTTSS